MGCSTCKKKVVKKLPEPVQEVLYTNQDLIKAYHELTNMKGVKEDEKPFISSVYTYIFNEQFDWNCGSCTSSQARKFHYYLTNELKLKL